MSAPAFETLVDVDPLVSLARIAEARAELGRLEREQVVVAIDELGVTWQQVGDALGVSEDAARRAHVQATRPRRIRRK
jgi:hypothetical protein